MYVKKKRWREKHIHFFPHDESKEFRYTRHVEHPISFLEGEQKIVKPSPLMNHQYLTSNFPNVLLTETNKFLPQYN